MENILYKKIILFCIIVLFIGSVVPSISSSFVNLGEVENMENIVSSKELNVATTDNIIRVDDIEGWGPGNPPENFTSIQEAIDNASTGEWGDTIYVYNGTYDEYINIDKSINLYGNEPWPNDRDKNGSIINCQENTCTYIVDIRVSNIYFSSFIINGNIDYTEAGINIQTAENITIKGCNISDIGLHGIKLNYTHNCWILGNNITNVGFGISSENSQLNNICYNNIEFIEGNCIILAVDSNDNIVKWNNISSHYGGNGVVVLVGCKSNEFYRNNVSNNYFGFRLDLSRNNKVNRNNIYNNHVGLFSLGSTTNARNNWWGGTAPSPLGNGDEIWWNLKCPLNVFELFWYVGPWKTERIIVLYDI